MRAFPGVKDFNCVSIRDAQAAVVAWLPLKHLLPRITARAAEIRQVICRKRCTNLINRQWYLVSAVQDGIFVVNRAAFQRESAAPDIT